MNAPHRVHKVIHFQAALFHKKGRLYRLLFACFVNSCKQFKRAADGLALNYYI
jgi:hypothetical protein